MVPKCNCINSFAIQNVPAPKFNKSEEKINYLKDTSFIDRDLDIWPLLKAESESGEGYDLI